MNTLSLIRRFPLFSGLTEPQLQAILPTLLTKRFEANSIILRQEETPGFVVIIVNGTIQSSVVGEDGRINSLSFFNSDDVIGWESVIDNMPLMQTLTVTKPTDLILIPIATAKSMLSIPWVAGETLRILTRTIRKLSDGQRVLGLPNAYQRVYSQIVSFTNESGAQNQATHLPKQQEIATMVNTSRETVSRAIQALIKQGILVKVGQQVLIQDPNRLKKLAADSSDKSTLER